MNDERWDFYSCRVDDAPASIRVALHHENAARPASCETLHVVGLEMENADEHGMGTGDEAAVISPAEDSLVERLKALGFVHVGRLRNRGSWQMTFYGSAARTEALLGIAQEVAASIGRGAWTHVDVDVQWTYYTSFLLPDVERRKWMADRSVVDQLETHGDVLTRPRPVDHELQFPSTEAAELFLEAAHLRGHARTHVEQEPDDAGRHLVSVRRVDSVELDHIHAVVMDLVELAAPYDGDHTGWGCTVETDM